MPSLTLQQFPLYYRALLHLTRHDHAREDTPTTNGGDQE
jgi:hypothetical protein